MTIHAIPAATAKGGATAARIRQVALDQFSRLGFERVTMGGIAQAAKVSQPTLHYHFQDKSSLWRSAMLELGAVIAEEERAMSAARDAPAIVQLRMAMRMFLQISWKHPALGRIVMLEGMAGGERLEWLDQHLIGPRNRRLVAVAREAIAAGDLKAHPPEQLVITLHTGAVGVINLAPLMRTSFGLDPETAAARAAHDEMVLDALFGGFLTEKGRAALETQS
ncbi:TetR/AcrR family transcriptional regulator [Phenylobacterium soli]|nr:TetR/AcrR family transcriptional regulator [Phenylobacterium soli]